MAEKKLKTATILFALLCVLCGQGNAADTRPNILWILVDDMSANFSCYGETTIRTPNVDALAAQGTRFSRAFGSGSGTTLPGLVSVHDDIRKLSVDERMDRVDESKVTTGKRRRFARLTPKERTGFCRSRHRRIMRLFQTKF